MPMPGASVTAQLEQRWAASQAELRKLASERHTLRSRLLREADRLREVESALRAETELRRQASDEHQAALTGLRSRLNELSVDREQAQSRISAELLHARAELEQARAELLQVRAELSRALAELAERASAGPLQAAPRVTKAVQGLRRIRGIGPGYERLLEQWAVTRVQQIASWTQADISAFAAKLKIRADRIIKDDWVGQARSLPPDPEE